MALSPGSQTEALSLHEPRWTSPSFTGTSTPQDLASPDELAQQHHNSLLVGSQEAEAAAPDNLKALNMLIRQDPFSMTLDANALLAGSLFLLMGMHFVPRFLLESFILAVPLFLLVRNDYQNFLRLGPGGTPATLAGYARLAWFRLFVLRDPFTPPTRSSSCSSSSSSSSSSSFSRPPFGILPRQNLPYRPGPRPTVAGIAPQRQLNQHGSAVAFTALRTTLAHLAATQPHKFGTATSCLEKHGFALFARHPVSEHVCGNGEVCHIHNSDRSMHMNLHPDDIAEVLAKGWAERHPLAFATAHKWWLPRSPLPETFVLVYSPRDESDLRVVCKIVEAAIWYTMEERVDIESLMFESQSQSQS